MWHMRESEEKKAISKFSNLSNSVGYDDFCWVEKDLQYGTGLEMESRVPFWTF